MHDVGLIIGYLLFEVTERNWREVAPGQLIVPPNGTQQDGGVAAVGVLLGLRSAQTRLNGQLTAVVVTGS
jgi:hypothetical protein